MPPKKRGADRAPRQAKTPRQRAEETVGVLARRHVRLMHRLDVLTDEQHTIRGEVADVEARLKHARAHPDLREEFSGDVAES